MAYRVSIFMGEPMDSTDHPPWWNNFIISDEHDRHDWLDNSLRKFRAKDVPGTTFIEFESEEDFTMFLLQFS